MIKVFHIIQSLGNGGCENMLLRVLPLMKKHEHIIVTLKERGELANKYEDIGIRVVNLEGNLWRLFLLVKKEKPGLIVTYLFHADVAGRVFLPFFYKGKIIPFLRTNYNYSKYWIARFFEKLSSPFVVNYFVNSKSVKNFYIKNLGITNKNYFVIPNGLDVSVFDRAKRHRLKTRSELKIDNNDVAVCCVANLHPNKGHTYLLSAFEEVYYQHKNVWLLLIGDGEERDALTSQVKSYKSKGRILFLGKRNNIPELLGTSDIFVLPTFFEGMSNALMEAMAASLPIITTKINENIELVGSGAILVETKSVAGIREGINSLIESKRRRENMGNKLHERVRRLYNIKATSTRFENAIKKVI